MISFFVPGKPQGKGRARAFRKGNHIGHYTPEKTRTYEGLIRTQALEAMGAAAPTRRPVSMTVIIKHDIPASWPKWKIQEALDGRVAPTTKPDADNVVKAVKDALNGVVWVDDAQVVMLDVRKIYDVFPGVFVEVRPSDAHPCQISKKAECAA